jgi:hypothetical protein
MKRYFSGITVAIVAIAAAAFTTQPKEVDQDSDTFFYNSGTYTEPQVETNANWQYGGDDCGGTANKACQMQVSRTYTHPVSGGRALNTTASGGPILAISATLGANSVDYVPDPATTTGISSPVNKP